MTKTAAYESEMTRDEFLELYAGKHGVQFADVCDFWSVNGKSSIDRLIPDTFPHVYVKLMGGHLKPEDVIFVFVHRHLIDVKQQNEFHPRIDGTTIYLMLQCGIDPKKYFGFSWRRLFTEEQRAQYECVLGPPSC